MLVDCPVCKKAIGKTAPVCIGCGTTDPFGVERRKKLEQNLLLLFC